MALIEADTSGITLPQVESGGHRARIWLLQYGPCWCRAEPGETGTFDFLRFRSAESAGLDRNLIIVSERVIVGSGQVLYQLQNAVAEPRLVIATSHCRAAGDFWEELPGGWAPVEELIPVDIHIPRCLSGYPEVLLATILDALSSSDSNAEPTADQKTTR